MLINVVLSVKIACPFKSIISFRGFNIVHAIYTYKLCITINICIINK
jgi:hypothetical protein